MVNELLSLHLGELAFADVILDEDIQEGGDTTNGHGCSVLILDSSEISKVNKLHCFASILGRLGHIETISLTHLHEILESLNLLSNLLAATDDIVAHLGDIQSVHIALLLLDEVVHTIKGYTTIVADDTTTTIGVGQSGDDMAMTCIANLLGISREDTLIVGLAILGIYLLGLGIEFVAIGIKSSLHHADTTLGEDAALEGCIGLKSYDDFVFLIYIACSVRGECLRQTGLGIIDTLLTLYLEHLTQLVPQAKCALCGWRQK